MKKIIIFIVITLILNYKAEAHNQHVHQYLVMEAYKLLKMQLGGDVMIMKDRLGDWTSYYTGDRPWQRGYITTGAWREDEEDVVYGYSKSSPPTLTGITGSIYSFISIFGGLTPDGFVSSTHFWDADAEDYSTIDIPNDLNRCPLEGGEISNAYLKELYYVYGNGIVLTTDPRFSDKWYLYMIGTQTQLASTDLGSWIGLRVGMQTNGGNLAERWAVAGMYEWRFSKVFSVPLSSTFSEIANTFLMN